MSLTIVPVNDPPLAVNDSAAVQQNSTNNLVNVLANDSTGPDTGETLTVTAVSAPASGTTAIAPNGTGILSKTAPTRSVISGDPVTFTLVVSNAGPDRATDVVVTDVMSIATQVTSMTSTQGTCQIRSQQAVVCAVGAIEPGASATITLVAIAPESKALRGRVVLENRASVRASELDANTTNNYARVFVTLLGRRADVRISKQGPITARATARFTYMLSVTNAGPITAENVIVTDALPMQLKFVSVSTGVGSCTGGSRVVCNLGSLPVGGWQTIAITVVSDTLGRISNTAQVQSTTPDDFPQNNSSSAITTIVSPNADVAVSTVAPRQATLGVPFDYAMTVINYGPDSSLSVSMNDFVSSGLRIDKIATTRGTCARPGSIIFCTFGRMAPAETAIVTITVTPLRRGMVTNAAIVPRSQGDPNAANNQSNTGTFVR